eukprot:1596795-Amphidinium_carterae.1
MHGKLYSSKCFGERKQLLRETLLVIWWMSKDWPCKAQLCLQVANGTQRSLDFLLQDKGCRPPNKSGPAKTSPISRAYSSSLSPESCLRASAKHTMHVELIQLLIFRKSRNHLRATLNSKRHSLNCQLI